LASSINYQPGIRKAVNNLFKKYGFDVEKIEAFFNAHKNEKRFAVYHDGWTKPLRGRKKN